MVIYYIYFLPGVHLGKVEVCVAVMEHLSGRSHT